MGKKIVSALLVLALAVVLLPTVGVVASAANATDMSAWIEADYPELSSKELAINDAQDFKLFQLEMCKYGTTFEGYTVYLNADIDLNPGWDSTVSLNWDENGLTADSVQTVEAPEYVLPAIDTTNNTGKTKQFGGIFDGQGHSISGLYLSLNAGNAASLFGQVIGTAEIKNLEILNSFFANGGADLTASKPLAAIFTNVPKGTTATITNCYVDVDLYDKSTSKNGNIHAKMGGLVGYCAGSLIVRDTVYAGSMSYNTASGSKRLDNAGGLVALVEGASSAPASVTVENFVFAGTIYSTYQRVAGVIGRSQGVATIKLTNCLNLGRIYAPYNMGGMIASILIQDAAVQNVTLADCYTVATDTAKLAAPAGTHNGKCAVTASVNGEVKYTLGDASSETNGTGYADVSFRVDVANYTGLTAQATLDAQAIGGNGYMSDVFVATEGVVMPKALHELLNATQPDVDNPGDNNPDDNDPDNNNPEGNNPSGGNPDTGDMTGLSLGFAVVVMAISAVAVAVLPKKYSEK